MALEIKRSRRSCPMEITFSESGLLCSGSVFLGCLPGPLGYNLTMATGGGKMKNLLVDALERLEEKDIKLFKSKLRCVAAPWGKNIPRGRLENADRLDLVELLVEFYEEKAATLMIAILEDMGFKKNASNLSKELKDQVQGYKKKYAKYVKEECKNIERNSLCGESIPLNSCYAKLLIIQKHQSQKQKEHELLATGGLHLEILRTYSHNLSIDLEDLFEPDESGTIPKTVVLQGPAGIGKSMTVQKIMLDWADGRLYPDMLKSHHIKALGPGIKNCTTLEFGDNKFGNSGVNVLCTILKQLGCNLADLKLDCNNLTDACAQELCTVLRTSHRLFSLGLQDNSFTENSVPFIQDLMKKCTNLAILDLSSNNFNKRGQKSLNLQLQNKRNSCQWMGVWKGWKNVQMDLQC
ncbi:NACHT LRR and PYD domains-containing protein 3-like [Crotalus adamanteus]|uniref:NACHT LRR and PYD domains-containing protein 3-like n=1 Tax=Crotalus adamanteus TaxID=8729 RepID=A0AAW1BW31_CROAD